MVDFEGRVAKKNKYVWQWISWVCGCGHSFFLLCWFLIRFAGTPQKCPKSAKCGEDWHVCTKHEQKGGALQAARANGMYSGQEGKWVECFWSVASSLLVLV